MWSSKRRDGLRASIPVCVLTAMVVQPSSSARGHSMSITRGTVVVQGEHLTISLTVPYGDLHHLGAREPDAQGAFDAGEVERAIGAVGPTMLARIAVRDARGQRMIGRCRTDGPALADLVPADHEAFQRSQVTVTLDYPIPEGTEYLSLQQVPGAADRGVASAFVLSVRHGAAPTETIRLTQGGNVEVISLVPRAPSAHRDDSVERIKSFLQTDALRSVRCVARVHDRGLRVTVHVPLQIMQTWVPVHREREDFLEVGEQTAYRSALSTLIVASEALLADGPRGTGRRIGVEFLDIGESERDHDQPERRLSAWTTRVQITTEFANPRAPRSFDLRWTLFNSVVLTAHVLVVSDDQAREYELSTYSPELSWRGW